MKQAVMDIYSHQVSAQIRWEIYISHAHFQVSTSQSAIEPQLSDSKHKYIIILINKIASNLLPDRLTLIASVKSM